MSICTRCLLSLLSGKFSVRFYELPVSMTNECHAVNPLLYNWNSFAKRLSQPLPVPQNPDRDFVLKVSALEIYNEVVKDLLASDSTPLRLLDDKEVMRLFSISLSKFWLSSLSIHRGFYLEMWYLSRSSSMVLIGQGTFLAEGYYCRQAQRRGCSKCWAFAAGH